MIGTVAGNFKIIEEIGEGGMGKVYKGVDTLLDREVAIKVLRPELTSQQHLVDRFLAEARVLSRLSHPHIAMLYAFFKQDAYFYMVMEYLRGETLDRRIRRTGLLAYDQGLGIFLQTLDAIGYAHSMGVIHRDLKPNNIMITEKEGVKVMDFGIARVVGSERMTREGSMIGTPEYMAPEQIRGHEVEPATDIYALGILLYEMLTGRLPFMSQNQFELMRMHIEQPPPPPRSFAPHVPADIEEVVLRALQKPKEARFASAYEFRDAILSCPGLPPLNLGGRSTLGGPVAFTSPTAPPRISQEQLRQRTAQPPPQQPYQPPPPPQPQQRMTMDVRQHQAEHPLGHLPPQPPRSGEQPRPVTPPPVHRTPSQFDQNATQFAGGHQTAQPPPQSATGQLDKPAGVPKPLLIGGVAVIVVLLVIVTWLFVGRGTVSTDGPTKPSPVVVTPKKFKADLVELTGGSFNLGRSDEWKKGSEEDQAWAYAQWPARAATVLPFAIDRTEVTNAEYAQFIGETGHPAPPDWNGKEPFADQDQFPVRNVSVADAEAFAAWRSKRDGVSYRLLTEEEWEFAARGLTGARYPWGEQWDTDRAHVASSGPKPVGSFPKGASPQGVLDLIGNIGEWTATKAAYYADAKVLKMLEPLTAADLNKHVVRGGSYISRPDGVRPIRATVRGFIDPTKKDPTVGFRLVRSL